MFISLFVKQIVFAAFMEGSKQRGRFNLENNRSPWGTEATMSFPMCTSERSMVASPVATTGFSCEPGWTRLAARSVEQTLAKKRQPRSFLVHLLDCFVHWCTLQHNATTWRCDWAKVSLWMSWKKQKSPGNLPRQLASQWDHRRRNRCTESLQANVERLKLYMSKLLLFPKKSGAKGVKKGDTPRSELQNVAQNTLKEIIPVPKPQKRIKARAITEEEKSESAYKKLKKARTAAHYQGERIKKAKEAAAKADSWEANLERWTICPCWPKRCGLQRS